MVFCRSGLLLKKFKSYEIVRRELSEALTFGNIFSPTNTLNLKDKLKDKSNMISVSKHLDGFKRIRKKAAVLVPFCTVDGKPSVILTLRSSKLSNHGGQVSFPGGMKDESDESLRETALRETEEEIGLSRDSIDVWGELPPLPGKNFDVLITPVIGFCHEVQVETLPTNNDEVVEVFTPMLESLSLKENLSSTTFTVSGSTYTLPVFLGQKYKVWGITALILYESLQLLMPELFPHKLKSKNFAENM